MPDLIGMAWTEPEGIPPWNEADLAKQNMSCIRGVTILAFIH
jgi:hypothetical protein